MAGHYGTNFEGKAVVKSLHQGKMKRHDDGSQSSKSESGSLLWQHNERRVLFKHISSRVNKGMQAYENDLNKRRQSLKMLLEEEECTLMKDLREKKHKIVPQNITANKDKIDFEDKNKIKDDHAILAKKLMQLDMEKCTEIRPLLQRRRNMETHLMQKLQIEERNELKNQERKMDSMWHDIMIKDSEVKREREENEKCERMRKVASTRDFLDAQVQIMKESQHKKMELEKEEERKLIAQLKKENATHLLQVDSAKNDSKTSLKDYLTKQIERQNESKKLAREQDYILQKKITSTALELYKDELRKKSANKELFKQELHLFGQQSSALKAERMAREKADNILFAETSLNLEENERNKTLIEKRRRELLKKALLGRDSQIEEKKRFTEHASKEAVANIEHLQKEKIKIMEEETFKKQQEAIAKNSYKEYLENQIRLSQMAKEKKAEEEKREMEDMLLEQKKYNERMVNLMKRDISTESVHPFKQVIEKVLEPGSTTRSIPYTGN